MDMRRALLLAWLLAACTVEPPHLPPLDGGTSRDGGKKDAGPKDGGDAGPPTCSEDDQCRPDQYCKEQTCAPRPVGCAQNDNCAPGDRCVRPLSGTSTITPGQCKKPEQIWGRCETDADCSPLEGTRCTARGFCSPPAVSIAGNVFSFCDSKDNCFPQEAAAAASTLLLIPGCSTHAQCGFTGTCRAGACSPCESNADCRFEDEDGRIREMECQAGSCLQVEPCSRLEDCFVGNTCMSNACVRASDCSPDGGDTIESAVSLDAAHYENLSLCGDRNEAWFGFQLSGRDAARIVLTATAGLGTFALDVFDDEGKTIDDAAYYLMPGVTAVEVYQPGFDDQTPRHRELRLRVSAMDVAGTYSLDLERVVPLCPGDSLDIYGDEQSQGILPILGNRTYELRACPADRDRVLLDAEADDRVRLQAFFAGSGSDLDLEVYSGTTTDTLLAEGATTSTSTETVEAGPLTGSGPLTLQAIARGAPSSGQPYTLSINRTLGTRFRACRDTAEETLVAGAVTVQGDLSAAVDLGSVACSGAPFAEPERNDSLYRLPPPSERSLLRAQLHHTVDNDSALAVAVIGKKAMTPESQDLCIEGEALLCDSAVLPRRALLVEQVITSTVDPVFVFVSSDGDQEDAQFTLELSYVSIAAQPENNSCNANAISLNGPGSGMDTELEILTYPATNTVEFTSFPPPPRAAACPFGPGDGITPSAGSGPDRFHKITLNENATGERAALELTGPRGGLLWVSENCGNNLIVGTCTAAADLSFFPVAQVESAQGGYPVARVVLEPAGFQTYFVVVDGLTPDVAGTFRLRTVVNPPCIRDAECPGTERCDDYSCTPVPAHNDCQAPFEINLTPSQPSAIIQGQSTGAADDDFQIQCTPISQPSNPKRDLVFSVDLSQFPQESLNALTARITDARFDPALEIREGECSASGARTVCNDDVRSIPPILLPEVTRPLPDQDVYYIVVDAFDGSGPFTLEVEVR